jgi:hypothetical protein
MGACDFESSATGETVAQAFNTASNDAAYDYGHAGYTGTIAEKPGYHLIGVPTGYTAEQISEALQCWPYEGDPRNAAQDALVDLLGEQDAIRAAHIWDDKWGSCIAMREQGKTNSWLFTGMASC